MVGDPAHYRWTSYRHNALGAADNRITAHALYLALNQNQPLGNARFYAKIERVTGMRRKA